MDLFTEEVPLASKNFLKLCKIKYYNNCLFFNVQRDFIAQCGDPTGTGTGGSSIYGWVPPSPPLCPQQCPPSPYPGAPWSQTMLCVGCGGRRGGKVGARWRWGEGGGGDDDD